MRFFEKIKLIERLDQLIKLKATGNTQELAKRMNVSRSTIYEIVDCMRAMGAEIEYCRYKKSLYYVKEVELSIGFMEKSKIIGGNNSINYNYLCLSDFFGQT